MSSVSSVSVILRCTGQAHIVTLLETSDFSTTKCPTPPHEAHDNLDMLLVHSYFTRKDRWDPYYKQASLEQSAWSLLQIQGSSFNIKIINNLYDPCCSIKLPGQFQYKDCQQPIWSLLQVSYSWAQFQYKDHLFRYSHIGISMIR